MFYASEFLQYVLLTKNLEAAIQIPEAYGLGNQIASSWFLDIEAISTMGVCNG
jgi:hypothetical protein